MKKDILTYLAFASILFGTFFWMENRYVQCAEDKVWKQSQDKRHLLEDFTNNSTLIRNLEDQEKKGTLKPDERVLLEQLRIQQQDRMKQIMERK